MTEGDQVFLGVAAHIAAAAELVDFKLRTPTTMLTAPAVPLEYLPTQ
jgi:hypothetical protein